MFTEFPHTCIPYVRWLCTSAKYRHLSACSERKSFALFIAKIALDILELIFFDVTFAGQVGVEINTKEFTFIDMFNILSV